MTAADEYARAAASLGRVLQSGGHVAAALIKESRARKALWTIANERRG